MTDCGIPIVTALPKVQQADFINNAMAVQLSNGQIVGWGDNTTGVLANGIAAASSQPAQNVLFQLNVPLPFGATIVDWAFTNANLYVVFSNGWVYSCLSGGLRWNVGLRDTASMYEPSCRHRPPQLHARLLALSDL